MMKIVFIKTDIKVIYTIKLKKIPANDLAICFLKETQY